jgi:aminopeptidase N
VVGTLSITFHCRSLKLIPLLMTHKTAASLAARVMVLLAVQTSSAQIRPPEGLDAYPTEEHHRFHQRVLTSSLNSAASNNIDVSYYHLDLRITTQPNRVSGNVRTVATVLDDNVTSITLDLRNNMIVDSVTVGNVASSFIQHPLVLEITLPHPYGTGEIIDVVVHYGGQPTTTGFGSFAFSLWSYDGTPWIWSLSEPYGARDWWSCKDHPSDKADSVDVWITVPANLKAGSQGILIEVVDNGDGTKTHKWKHRYPIATYLVSIAVGNYTAWSDWYKYTPTDSMEVLNYFLAPSPAQVELLRSTIIMLEIFSDLFGPYPFITEKYGHAQFGWGGGMEHQTMTSVSGNLSENLIAHELAHQWFGDLITMNRWSDIWLNEGFAQYSTALYRERRYGWSNYWTYMNTQFNNARNAVGSLFVSDTTTVQSLFNGNLVYSKGAVVLHMLRGVLGDSLFFRFIKEYALDSQLQFATASTTDVQRIAETVSAMDLMFFFDQWIYGSGYPQYNVDWRSGIGEGGTGVQVRIVQPARIQPPAFFIMPVQLRFRNINTDTVMSVWVRSPDTTFTFDLSFVATGFDVDPNNWILKGATITYMGEATPVSTSYRLFQNFPNPFNASTVIPFELPRKSRVRMEVFNMLGILVETLIDQELDAGLHQARWSPMLSSGLYLCRLTATPYFLHSRSSVQTIKLLLVK